MAIGHQERKSSRRFSSFGGLGANGNWSGAGSCARESSITASAGAASSAGRPVSRFRPPNDRSSSGKARRSAASPQRPLPAVPCWDRCNAGCRFGNTWIRTGTLGSRISWLLHLSSEIGWVMRPARRVAPRVPARGRALQIDAEPSAPGNGRHRGPCTRCCREAARREKPHPRRARSNRRRW